MLHAQSIALRFFRSTKYQYGERLNFSGCDQNHIKALVEKMRIWQMKGLERGSFVAAGRVFCKGRQRNLAVVANPKSVASRTGIRRRTAYRICMQQISQPSSEAGLALQLSGARQLSACLPRINLVSRITILHRDLIHSATSTYCW